MSDSANGTATGLKPDTIQLDSMLTVSCSTGQASDTILTFAGELDAVSADRAYRYVRDTIDIRGGPVRLDVASLSFCDAASLPQPQMALLDLQSADGIRPGYCSLRETFGGRLTGVIIQTAAGAGLITPGLRDGRPYTPASGPGAVHTRESAPGPGAAQEVRERYRC
jgi:hypothetical protein